VPVLITNIITSNPILVISLIMLACTLLLRELWDTLFVVSIIQYGPPIIPPIIPTIL
jgi:hypothetical protein